MSGPKTYTPSYEPPVYVEPDRSATYHYSMSSAEEAAGVIAQLSAFGNGVRVSVVNNRITIDVSDSAWHNGYTADAIRNSVSQARARYERELLERRKRQEIAHAENMRKLIASSAAEKRKKLEAARSRAEALSRSAAVTAKTPFGTYDMDADVRAAKSKVAAITQKLAGIDAEIRQKQQACDKYIADIRACNALGALGGVYVPNLNVAPALDNEDVADMEREVAERRRKFDAFTAFLDKTDKIISGNGLEEYRSRIADKIRAANMYSPSAISEINELVGRIEREHKATLEQQRIAAINSETAKSAEARIAALEKIRAAVTAFEATALSTETTEADYKSLNRKLLDECDGALDGLTASEYLSPENAATVRAVKAELDQRRNRLLSPETHKGLTATLARLHDAQKRAAADSELYARFKQRSEIYDELAVQINEIVAAQNAKSTVAKTVVPPALAFDRTRADALIAELDGRIAALQTTLDEYKKHTAFGAIATAVDGGRCGKTFKRERNADGTLHMLYARSDSKGAIYDATSGANGEVCVTPRGVILSNGRLAITPEELKRIHEKCGWADELAAAFAEIGLPAFGWTERGDDERAATYDSKNFYVIKTYEESRRYLKLAGFSESRIAEFGYGEESRQGSGRSEAANVGQAAAIDPHKK